MIIGRGSVGPAGSPRRRALGAVVVLLVCTAAGLAGGAVRLAQITPQFRSSTVLLVGVDRVATRLDSLAAEATARARAVGYAQVAGTTPAADDAADVAGLPAGPVSLGLVVYASASATDRFVRITVTGPDAGQVQALAGAFVQTLPVTAAGLRVFRDGIASLTTVLAPTAPGPPYSPVPWRVLAAGTAAGLAAALGLFALVATVRTRVRGVTEIETLTGWPVLADLWSASTPGAGDRLLPIALALPAPAPGGTRRWTVLAADRATDPEPVARGVGAQLRALGRTDELRTERGITGAGPAGDVDGVVVVCTVGVTTLSDLRRVRRVVGTSGPDGVGIVALSTVSAAELRSETPSDRTVDGDFVKLE